MKIYKTNQESLDKGILNNFVKSNFISDNTYWVLDSDKKGYTVFIDNRIKGYCLKEC